MSCNQQIKNTEFLAETGTFYPVVDDQKIEETIRFAKSNWQFLQKIDQLRPVLRKCWGKDTALNGAWDAQNPAINQCAITALVVQDYLGGKLLRCPTSDGGSHYWNLLPNGREVDLTAEQFAQSKVSLLKDSTIEREKDYVLSFPETKKRYLLLKQKMADFYE